MPRGAPGTKSEAFLVVNLLAGCDKLREVGSLGPPRRSICC